MMLTSTLGGLIKDFRIKKRLSQLEISLRIGWSDTTRLSKIEQGRVGRPTRPTLDKIMDALDLNEHEKGEMLLASNLIPTKKEVGEVLKRLESKLKEFDCPLMLVDFSWNVFYMNDECRKLYKVSDENYKSIEKNNPNWLEMLFLKDSFKNSQIKSGYSQSDLKPLKEFEIAHFKYEQEGNDKERWFRNLLLKLSENLEFRELWAKINPPAQEHLLYEYEVGEFDGQMYNIYSIHPTFDFRFYLMVHQHD